MTLIDLTASFASLDVPAIVETASRGTLATIMKLPNMKADLDAYLQSDPKNYFGAGREGGKIFKMLMDFNINN